MVGNGIGGPHGGHFPRALAWILATAALTAPACATSPDGEDAPFWRPSYGDDAASKADDAAADGTGARPSDPPPTTSPPTGAPDSGRARPVADAAPTNPPADGDAPPPPSTDASTPPDAGTPPPIEPCSLTATVTTVSPNGKYSPRNIGAIWIATASGTWVKSLNVWAARRIQYLQKWNAATKAAGAAANVVDAVTGATMASHGTRAATWDCTDVQKATVPDGDYSVCFELTDQDSAGPSDCVAFTKGPNGATLTPADTTTFTQRTIVFTP